MWMRLRGLYWLIVSSVFVQIFWCYRKGPHDVAAAQLHVAYLLLARDYNMLMWGIAERTIVTPDHRPRLDWWCAAFTNCAVVWSFVWRQWCSSVTSPEHGFKTDGTSMWYWSDAVMLLTTWDWLICTGRNGVSSVGIFLIHRDCAYWLLESSIWSICSRIKLIDIGDVQCSKFDVSLWQAIMNILEYYNMIPSAIHSASFYIAAGSDLGILVTQNDSSLMSSSWMNGDASDSLSWPEKMLVSQLEA